MNLGETTMLFERWCDLDKRWEFHVSFPAHLTEIQRWWIGYNLGATVTSKKSSFAIYVWHPSAWSISLGQRLVKQWKTIDGVNNGLGYYINKRAKSGNPKKRP